MINLLNVSKSYNSKKVLDKLNLVIPQGKVYGIVGPNGSGKSTLLRLLSGIYKLDEGFITINGNEVYDNVDIKKQAFFVSDEPYYDNHESLNDLKAFYKLFYPTFSEDKYKSLLRAFPINEHQKLKNMSKGMKRQALLIIALACCPKYIYLDEAFDGLDPVMRSNFKKIITDEINDNNITVVIASHNIRELEDICDELCLLLDGTIKLSGNKEALALQIHKVQIGRTSPSDPNDFKDLNVLSYNCVGNVTTLVLHEPKEAIDYFMNSYEHVLFEYLNISLEEMFVYEMEANGYGKYED